MEPSNEVPRSKTKAPDGESLIERRRPGARIDDVALAESSRELLRSIVAAARKPADAPRARATSRNAAAPTRTKVSALFVGPDRTARETAAAAVASALDVELYRVDLSRVVSKYIGETEKNLNAVFDAAEQGGAVLLLDGCDTSSTSPATDSRASAQVSVGEYTCTRRSADHARRV